jgi:hypothetical protein
MTESKKISIFLISMGICIIFYKGYQYFSIMSCKNWPSTKGQVIELEKYNTKGRTGSDQVFHYIHIKYSYQVDGENYSSTRSRLSGNLIFSDTEKRDQKFKEFSKPITVYYNDEDPKKSYLIFNTRSDVKAGAGIGLLLILLGSLFLLVKDKNRIHQSI